MALKELELFTRFHSLRNYPQLLALANVDHGIDNVRITRVGSDLLHKRLIELQRVDRETPKICKAGITRAKVVDRQPHAHGFQRTKRNHRRFRVVHKRALGHFQF